MRGRGPEETRGLGSTGLATVLLTEEQEVVVDTDGAGGQGRLQVVLVS